MSAARIRAWVNANPAVALFALGLVGAVGVILAAGWHTTFMRGEWDLLLYRRRLVEATFLEPSGGNLVLGTAAIYRALLHVFGLDPVPSRILLTALLAVSAVLLFVTLRRRIGDIAAAFGAGLTLLMGAAYQALLWPLSSATSWRSSAGSVRCWRSSGATAAADALACGLLCVGTLTFSAGLAFVVTAAVIVAMSPGAWRRAWVAAIPAGLFAIWLVIWGTGAVAGPIGSEILDSPLFMLDGFASSIAALLGLSTQQNASGIDGIDWGRALLLVGAVAAFVRLRRVGKVPPRLVAALAGAAAFWLVAGAYEEPGRLATASRYTYIGAVFVLLIVAELVAGLRLRRPAVIAILAMGAIVVASSAAYLGHAANRYERQGELERAGLTAIELTRDSVTPDFALRQGFVGSGWAPIQAGPYLTALDAHGGSLGLSESELRRAPLYVRSATDRTVAAAHGIAPTPASQVTPATSCTLADASSRPVTVQLPSGGARLDPLGGSADIAIGRFANVLPVEVGVIGPAHGRSRHSPRPRGSPLAAARRERGSRARLPP